jgi:hypothetical protein
MSTLLLISVEDDVSSVLLESCSVNSRNLEYEKRNAQNSKVIGGRRCDVMRWEIKPYGGNSPYNKGHLVGGGVKTWEGIRRYEMLLDLEHLHAHPNASFPISMP